jgi:hypothetical protein
MNEKPLRPLPIATRANARRSGVSGSNAEILTGRDADMEEQELLSMISFTLKESANRMTALAAEVRSETVRAELAELSRQLLHYAKVVDRM